MKALIVISLIIMTSCGTSHQLTGDPENLYGTKWNLRKITSGDRTVRVDSKAFIRFDKEKGSAGGNGSCNSFGSNFKQDENGVQFSNIFSTKMYCEAVQKTENEFFKQLALVNRFEVNEKQLVLYKDKQALLEFEAE